MKCERVVKIFQDFNKFRIPALMDCLKVGMKKSLILFLLILISFAGNTQDMEVGVYAGGSYYIGDLNPSIPFQGTQLAYGLIARYNFDSRWAVRLNAFRGKLEGSAQNTWFLPARNLTFTSPVTDISAVAEFNFLPYFTGSRRNFITPYIYAGIGVFFFNPSSGGVALRALGTEGQQSGYLGRKPYSLTNVNVPFGLGVKLSVAKRLGITAFWEMHKTFTDYNDDVSTTYYLDWSEINPDDQQQYYSDPTMSYKPGMQRGNSRNQDWYSFSGITITYKFATDAGKRCRDVYQY